MCEAPALGALGRAAKSAQERDSLSDKAVSNQIQEDTESVSGGCIRIT